MKTFVWTVIAIIAIVLIVGSLGHILLLAAVGGGCFLAGRGYEKGTKAIGRRRSRGTLSS